MATGSNISRNTHHVGQGEGFFSRLQTALSEALAPSKFSIDRKIFENSLDLMDKVVKLCQHAKMNLNKKPPYIIDILRGMGEHLRLVLANHEERMYLLDDSVYFRVFIENLIDKCKKTIKLFKDGKEKMFIEGSDFRRKLTKVTLVFWHMLAELKSIFTDGTFSGDAFQITVRDASDWWQRCFGNSTVVPWTDFRQSLNDAHPMSSTLEEMAVRATINLTASDYISCFEFDVFTRLFRPWAMLLKNWKVLAVTHPGYVNFQTYDEVKTRLQKFINKPGSYVFRMSITQLGQWAIGFVTENGRILQTIPEQTTLCQALLYGQKEGLYLYPDGRDRDVDISPVITEYPEIESDDGILYQDPRNFVFDESSETNKKRRKKPKSPAVVDEPTEYAQIDFSTKKPNN